MDIYVHEFKEIEDLFIDALTGISGLKTLDVYSGQADVDEIEEIIFQFPCIYVIAGRLNLERINRYDRYVMEVMLLVGDKNLRGAKAAARGDASSQGVYEYLLQARYRLHNKKLSADWTPPYVISEQPLVYMPNESICLYEANYRMQAVR